MLVNFFREHKLTVILVAAILMVIGIGFFAYQKITNSTKVQAADLPEIDLNFDPEGSYAVLLPRGDGNAMTINILRTASYDSISYELAYNAEGVDGGVRGDINTKDKKGEYEQEVLFGSCSTGGKCVFDKGVENGTLTLHVKKGIQPYRLVTQWHLQKPDVALGLLNSGDGHFTYKIDSVTSDLSLLKFTIINDLSGSPKLPAGKQIVGKVYALNVPVAKNLSQGNITIELASSPPQGSKIASFSEEDNQWTELDTKLIGSTLTSKAGKGNIFTIFTSPQS